ncbi:MAG: D-inositol-3-phosphate glycosyltransferase [Actinomycetales bacterium]|nr:D-inositol-3-phosphate glycosyltransferase [Actinomycetales bacterium]
MISVHTSPVDQPGTGDAGGLNVYVAEVAKQLARRGREVEIFTRATTGTLPPTLELAPGVTVRHVTAGPYEGLSKHDLPGQLCAFAAGVMRAGAARPEGWFDLVHSHYWLSGQVGWLAADRWRTPLVHTMHTMARVKNAALAVGDSPEPQGREIGEAQVVEAADRLVANTVDEACQLVELYGADPTRVSVVPPGVDLDLFAPGDRYAARGRLGLPLRANILLFVGRIQPLKAPDLLVKAARRLLDANPHWTPDDLVVAIIGGPSGSGLEHPEQLGELVADLGLAAYVRFVPPVDRVTLARWYRAADLVTVPSYNESFGLVAIEALACGTPVVAAKVGGLPTAVGDGGVLVPGHDVGLWADTIGGLLADEAHRDELGRRAVRHASGFGWGSTTERLLQAYGEACRNQTAMPITGANLLVGVPSAVIP